MNSLDNYISDEELQTNNTHFSQGQGKYKPTEQDTNYDNITMEMSEESSHHEPSSPRSESSDSRSSSSSYQDESERKSKKKDSYQRSDEKSQHSESPDYHKSSRESDKRSRKHWRDDYYRDRDRDRDDDRRSYRHSRSPSYHRYDRSRKSRSRSRDRGRHSRHHSPSRRRREHHDRSRGSGGGGNIGGGNGGGPCDRKPSKLSILEKLGIELKLPESDKDSSPLTLPSYYNPVAMNPAKYAEQIAKRKLLWGNSQKQKPGSGESNDKNDSRSTSVWQGARFSQDQDGKLTAKFQRLMGIKKDSNGGDSSTSSQVRQEKDLFKKQEELFSSMELQYEVARQATHTQRGVGLGFGAHHFSSK